MPSIVTIGETMALLGTPDHCLFRTGSAPSLTIGGAESNVAIAAARLGVQTTWIGRVGDDDLGSLVVRELLGQGVTVRARRDPEAPTGLMVKEHRGDSTTTHVRYYRKHSAGSRLGPEDVDQDCLADADILHLTGITAALGAGAREALRHAIAVARGAGAMISFDVNYRATLWSPDAAGPVLRELAGVADIVFAGPDEAALLLPGGGDSDQGDDPWLAAIELAPTRVRTGTTDRRRQTRIPRRVGPRRRHGPPPSDHPDRPGRPGRCGRRVCGCVSGGSSQPASLLKPAWQAGREWARWSARSPAIGRAPWTGATIPPSTVHPTSAGDDRTMSRFSGGLSKNDRAQRCSSSE